MIIMSGVAKKKLRDTPKKKALPLIWLCARMRHAHTVFIDVVLWNVFEVCYGAALARWP